MTLRINRLLDPKKFSEEFSQKIEMAKMMCKSKDTQQEGYANLLDYYELEPNYKGLKDLIYQVEIEKTEKNYNGLKALYEGKEIEK